MKRPTLKRLQGHAPSRQNPEKFSDDADRMMTYLAGMPDDLDGMIDYNEGLLKEIEGHEASSAASKASAASSAAAAAAAQKTVIQREANIEKKAQEAAASAKTAGQLAQAVGANVDAATSAKNASTQAKAAAASEAKAAASAKEAQTHTKTMAAHIKRTDNPHKVTAAQVGALALSGGTLAGNLTITGNVLYPQHGIYLGGSGTHNLLDDFEQGTWTPTTPNGSWTINYAPFVKMGNLVTCFFGLTSTSSISASDFGGLPFTPDTAQYGGGIVGYQDDESDVVWTVFVQGNTGIWNLRAGSTQKGLSNNKTIYGFMSYIAA